MLYTIMPLDYVFGNANGEYNANGAGMGSPEHSGVYEINETLYNGQLVQTQRNTNGEWVMCRLMSTDPRAYLDGAFAPGRRLARRRK